ncbi:hypothetical protein GGTG_07063 [Gaeumannomyces tritici R3-111a-1]|uniref:Uncharacterized protein n=1 Tax=Gaeumannomyces tritici (strain R3-111a-1) TaxID=644352 RepID=J3P0L8_GAET3|nr:hypothetical protein GGTG_07063 [Gaeumannomyces tritici R3-111a-1]EJT77151.1 hypothetical protein GGTG_07063 [Gaeumannomyces tritici R3-111a-1]
MTGLGGAVACHGLARAGVPARPDWLPSGGGWVAGGDEQQHDTRRPLLLVPPPPLSLFLCRPRSWSVLVQTAPSPSRQPTCLSPASISRAVSLKATHPYGNLLVLLPRSVLPIRPVDEAVTTEPR